MDNYDIIKRIGTGFNAWVELAVDRRTNEQVALKVFHNLNTTPLTTNNIFINERQMLQKLDRCKGVIKLLTWSQVQYIFTQPTFNAVPPPKFLVLQYYHNGDLLQYVKNNCGAFKEEICRPIFAQILEIVELIHKQGVVHRDLKLENILVDDDFNFHLADFGFATMGIDEKGRQKKLNDFLGSIAYAAPEMFLGDPYLGIQTDVFQLGVCLFILATGCQPFQKAHPKDDWLYRLIGRNQWAQFWEYHENSKKLVLSNELKDLLIRMLSLAPNQRLEIQCIKIHQWFQQNWASESCWKHEFVERMIHLKSQMNQKYQSEEAKK